MGVYFLYIYSQNEQVETLEANIIQIMNLNKKNVKDQWNDKENMEWNNEGCSGTQ